MAQRQVEAIEAVNAGDTDVSIQAMADSINISPYPYGEEPLTRLELVDETFTKVLGCNAGYEPTASTEDLG